MLSLTFGVAAAVIWAVHDLLARKLSQGLPLLPILIVVLAAGSLAAAIPVVAGQGGPFNWDAAPMAVLSGTCFAVAIGSLYRAFSMAPVRIVSPIIGAYPMLSMWIAAAQGRAITLTDWLAVLAIVIGIAIVAGATDKADQTARPPYAAMAWAGLSAAAFALTFASAQQAVEDGNSFGVILISRLAALVLVAALWTTRRQASGFGPLRRYVPLLCLMGLMDAVALGLVTFAGGLPRPEYASVSSALFGVLTVLLATFILRERASGMQWFGILVTFAAVGVLALQA